MPVCATGWRPTSTRNTGSPSPATSSTIRSPPSGTGKHCWSSSRRTCNVAGPKGPALQLSRARPSGRAEAGSKVERRCISMRSKTEGGIMKRAVSVFFAAMFLVASVAGGFAQAPQAAPGQGRPGGDGQGRGGGRGRGPAAPACTTFACDIQADWDRNRDLFVNIANAMPDDKFGFKPTPAQRSYAEQILHVAGIDIKLLSTLGGKTPAPAINDKATAKADVM